MKRKNEDTKEQNTPDKQAKFAETEDTNEQEEEEDDRFFESKLDETTQKAFDYVDAHDRDSDGPRPREFYTEDDLNRLLSDLEKAVALNVEQRARYSDEPLKFMDSEHQLHESIKVLSALSDSNLFEKLSDSSLFPTLVELIVHDNEMIGKETLVVLDDFFDEDNFEGMYDELEYFSQALLNNDILTLLLQFLGKFVENPDSDDAKPAYQLLSSMIAFETVSRKILSNRDLIQHLFSRIADQTVTPPSKSSSKVYSVELVFALLQDNTDMITSVVQNTSIEGKDCTDVLLTEAARYRTVSPAERASEEGEYAKNVFNILVLLARNISGKDLFVQNEGVELMVILINQGKWAKMRALKVLAEASKGYTAGEVAVNIVRAGGLKPLFFLFSKEFSVEYIHMIVPDLLWIFSSLLRWLDIESPERIRVMSKFVEKKGKHISRLVRLRIDIEKTLRQIGDETREEKEEIEKKGTMDEYSLSLLEAQAHEKREQAGLQEYRNIDIILMWLYTDAGEIRDTVSKVLSEINLELDQLKGNIGSYMDELKPLTENTEDEGLLDAVKEAKEFIEMLEALRDYLTQ